MFCSLVKQVLSINLFPKVLKILLTGSWSWDISDEQYQHLQNVWDTFNFNIFEDFHNHCLKKVVLLLAHVYYDLDPCHYFSAPGLSWDNMLKMTRVTLEKMSDPDK